MHGNKIPFTYCSYENIGAIEFQLAYNTLWFEFDEFVLNCLRLPTLTNYRTIYC